MEKVEYQAKSLADLDLVAAKLVAKFRPGGVIGLSGPLGAGKTALVKAIARQLGIKDQVISPTYLYHQVYEAPELRVHHLDLYRIKSMGDFEALDIPLDDDRGFFLIEWIENVPELLPIADFCLRFKLSGETRIIEEVLCKDL
ncbi:tRNA (adenosine(37)-N6)-threonylcarbamoyltransferase complex ATPase subunit type 1 TsaE [Candidatus Berkelbacteria bacterium]|nr:tRNA (adenosine(37)-N6)-threonylcarbamoyltransferase complex ATPase subunit type 1 TsaE [Candidatus Berkelbacteria bacterium]